jgi:hypothetical protein
MHLLLGNVFEDTQGQTSQDTALPPENVCRSEQETLDIIRSGLAQDTGRLGWYTEPVPTSVVVATWTGADAAVYPFIVSLK